jgi:hypothetical protein
MQSVYFLLFTLLGGVIATFAVAGWSSYSEGKLPELQAMFRWFLAGITAAGLSAYVWLFGAGGDPTKLLESVTKSLEVKEMMENITSSVGGGAVEPENILVKEKPTEITVGMPNF